ncbi:hypothetical protein M8J76_013118 [Diaphorina citri]|nr:hypothetical protein M8J76_013118 [Diaphorina citri]
MVGSDLSLLCQAQGYPVPFVRWFKFIEGSSRKVAVPLNDRVKQVSGTLIIKEAKVEDSGKYLCVVNNSVGGESVETVLTVTAPLAAGVEPTVQTIDFGRPAQFTCKYEGNPVKTISWMKDGKPVPDHNEPVFRIDSVRKEDKGMYQCVIRNEQESAQASGELKLGGRFDPPVIKESFSDETLNPGPNYYFKCIASGNPTPEISWYLDGKKLVNAERIQVGQYVSGTGDVVSHLNITNVQTNDGGRYKCVASSKVGSVEHTGKLNVYGLPFVRPMEKKAIVAGETLVVTCPVAGYPIESIFWEREGRTLPINRKQKVFPNGTLIIENVERQSDQATYTCVAKTAQGYSSRGTLEVQVMVLPHILPFTIDEDYMWGDPVQLTCVVTKGDLPLTIGWSFQGGQLSSHHGIVTTKLGDRASLLSIASLNINHSGQYTCTVKNFAGITNYTTNVIVKVLPKVQPFSFGDTPFEAGETTSVQCLVSSGDLPLNITWLLNNASIPSSNGITIARLTSRTSVLTIESVSHTHVGHYSCLASNVAGSSVYESNLLPFSFGDTPFEAGETTSVQCLVSSGDLPLNITWLLNNATIPTSSGVTVSRASSRISALTIESVSHNHVGHYSCIATNPAGSSSYESNLLVNVPPRIQPFSFGAGEESVSILEQGESASISCLILSGDLPISFQWLFNGAPLDTSRDVSVVTPSRKLSVLSIDSVTFEHVGNYSCLANNTAARSSYTASLLVNVPPRIQPFSFGEESSSILEQGESASISCHILSGDLPISFQWLFNGAPLDTSRDVSVVTPSRKLSVLSIDSVTFEHVGNYSCLANNTAARSSYTASLLVNVPPKIQPFSFGDETLSEGEMASVSCLIHSGDLPITFLWLFNGAPITDATPDITIAQNNRKLSVLSIESVTYEHVGNYTCMANNTAAANEYTAVLSVNVPPKIQPFSFGEDASSVLEDGETASVSCLILSGDLPITFLWLFNGAPITDATPDITIAQNNRKLSVLSIESVTYEHVGNYTCMANNTAAANEYTAVLSVNVPPKIQPFSFGETSLEEGETTSVSCLILSGDLPISFLWLFNGAPLGDLKDVFIGQTSRKVSVLTIEAVTHEHAGNYTCVANNSAAISEHSATLMVNVPPKIQPFSFGDDPLEEGDTSIVNCLIFNGDLPINFTWLFNARPIPADSNLVSISQSSRKLSVLSIESLTYQHAGNYTCVATNEAATSSYSSELKVNVVPRIQPFSFGDDPMEAGEPAAVNCLVLSGDQPINITWLFNGAAVTSEMNDISVSQSNRKLSILSIMAVSHEHVGNYTCVASNFAGTSEVSSALLVNVPPKIQPFTFGDEAREEGDTTSVSCLILTGDLPMNITWLINGKVIRPEDYPDISVTQSGRRISMLAIEAVKHMHAGNYTCFAVNNAANASFSAELNVNVPPKIQPFSFGDEPLSEGQATSVSCLVSSGDLPLAFSWFLNGEQIDGSDDILISQTGRRISQLSIDAVDHKHMGNYSCVASNNASSVTYSAELMVNVSPKIQHFSFGDEPLSYGEFTTINCMVSTGDLPLNISWTFNGKPLASLEGLTIAKTSARVSALTIDSVTHQHAGNYTCFAANRAGTSTYNAILNVNG